MGKPFSVEYITVTPSVWSTWDMTIQDAENTYDTIMIDAPTVELMDDGCLLFTTESENGDGIGVTMKVRAEYWDPVYSA